MRLTIALGLIVVGCSSATSTAPSNTDGGATTADDPDPTLSNEDNANSKGGNPTTTNPDGTPPPASPDGDRFGIESTPLKVLDTVTTSLPKLPTLVNVSGRVTGDSVKVHFDTFDGAKDYRIYALPADKDITVASDGHISAKGATYRCAGDRMAPQASIDTISSASGWMKTLVQSKVGDYTRSLPEATLGYVYATPASDRIPVYALGDPDKSADNECYYGRWTESRVKKYVTSDTDRKTLISQRWRDDGIAFYYGSDDSGGRSTR